MDKHPQNLLICQRPFDSVCPRRHCKRKRVGEAQLARDDAVLSSYLGLTRSVLFVIFVLHSFGKERPHIVMFVALWVEHRPHRWSEVQFLVSARLKHDSDTSGGRSPLGMSAIFVVFSYRFFDLRYVLRDEKIELPGWHSRSTRWWRMSLSPVTARRLTTSCRQPRSLAECSRTGRRCSTT